MSLFQHVCLICSVVNYAETFGMHLYLLVGWNMYRVCRPVSSLCLCLYSSLWAAELCVLYLLSRHSGQTSK